MSSPSNADWLALIAELDAQAKDFVHRIRAHDERFGEWAGILSNMADAFADLQPGDLVGGNVVAMLEALETMNRRLSILLTSSRRVEGAINRYMRETVEAAGTEGDEWKSGKRPDEAPLDDLPPSESDDDGK